MIRTLKVIFCDEDHGHGEVTFPDFDRSTDEIVKDLIDGPTEVKLLRKAAKQIGWGRVNGGDYCPGCTEGMSSEL